MFSLFSLLPAPAHRAYQEANDDDLERAYSQVSHGSRISFHHKLEFVI